MNERFEKDVDTLLSGLTWERKDTNAVYSALKGERTTMIRKWRLLWVMTALLILLAAVAFAIGLRYSPRHTAVQTAREAVMKKYGLTTEMLRMYIERITEENGVTTVRYEGVHSEFLKAEPMGDYTAVVDAKGTATAAWSHDSEDSSLWQYGDLGAEVWGPTQLQMALDRYRYYQQWSMETPYLSLLSIAEQIERLEELDRAIAPCRVHFTRTEAPDPSDMPEEEALALGVKALKETCGIELDEEWRVERSFQTDAAENSVGRGYLFSFQKGGDGIRPESHRILVQSPSGEIVTSVNPLVKEEVSPDQAANEMAAIPAPAAELTQEAALETARGLLQQYYHLTDEMRALFTELPSLGTRNGKPVWTIAYLPITIGELDNYDQTANRLLDWRWNHELTPKLGYYIVRLDAKNGETQDAIWSLEGTENTSFYTKSDWANAKVYDARILQWVLELLKHNDSIIRRYQRDQTEWFTVEDAAAYDQAFRDAGFDAARYRHALPKQGDLTADQARMTAIQAMQSEYGLTQAQIDESHITTGYVLDNGGEWQIGFYTMEGMGSVTLNAGTGEIQKVHLDSGASSNG